MAGNFRIADGTLANARSLVQDEAAAEVLNVNELAAELAKVNRDLVAAREGTAGRAALLDARDQALRGPVRNNSAWSRPSTPMAPPT